MDPHLQADIRAATAALGRGELVAFPTETVYGLGAHARNVDAVRQIFILKGRPANHPLIVHLPPEQPLEAWGEPSTSARMLAEQFWPGPLTLVLRRQPGVPDAVTGGLETVGLRRPAHPIALALLKEFGDGIAAPSANRFGCISPTSAEHVREELGDGLLILDGGSCAVGIESTIVDLSQERPALLRPGGISTEALEAVIGPLGPPTTTRAPGTLAAHYAPETRLMLSRNPEELASKLRNKGLQVAIFRALEPTIHAQLLYAELRRLDHQGVDVLIAEPASATGLGSAINDRLERAARSWQDI